ncbi:MAG TPA: flagellar hook-basal body complex protein [Xanthobacteraceae bacterium]|nr:flagellar hook-basal body complex protein [Xanthobacteraceae bacterium]
MGIFDALTTAVAGLQAQSFALQNISGNIANSQTTGYKETDTSFQDLVSQAAQNQQTADGVIANSVATNTVQGTINSTQVSTDMAINGDGWFVVAQPTGFTDNQPVFSGVTDFTRAGNFQLNDNGNLVNAAGYYLMGIPVNPTTGNPEGSVPQVLQFQNNFIPAQETTSITYEANLPSAPTSGAVNPSDYANDPIAGSEIIGTGATLLPDAAATGTGTVSSLTDATTLTSLGLAVNDTVSVGDGTNTTVYTVGAGSTVGDLINAINSGAAGNAAVTASLSGGNIVLTGSNDTGTISVTGSGANDAADLGFGSSNHTFAPTNLLTQGLSGKTLTVSVGGGLPQTITFGTGANDVETMAQLQTRISDLTGVIGSVNTSNGNISLLADDPTASLLVGGTASPSTFGIQTPSVSPGNGTVIGSDLTTFTDQSVAGGSITAYDSEGNPLNIQFRWAQVDNSSGQATWNLFYQTNSSASGTQAAWQNVGQNFIFNSSGQLTQPTSSALNIPALTINGDTLNNVEINFGSNGLTQFANTSGTAQVTQLQQNGFAAGQLQSVAVDSENRVVGTFTNGQTIPLAEITLATFNGEDALQALNGGAYAATADSGPPIYGATGKIDGSSLESSNVDISTQFSNLIVAQQAYSANARVMTTANQMIQSLLQVIQ